MCGGQGRALLKITNLSVRYFTDGAPVQAVCGASLAILQGESIGVLGESGSGKSTLARAILGLLPATARAEGSIRFQDIEITSAKEEDLRPLRGAQVALVSQDPALTLNPVLAIGTQIDEVLRSHTSLSGHERKLRVIETLRSVGFAAPEQISRRYAHQLSGGERQRAAIAQAIACRPSLLVADEATSKLDAALKLELLELFASLRARFGMALLLITHEPAVIASATERLLVMYAGEIVEAGPTATVLRNPLHPYTQAFVQLARERAWTNGPLASRFSSIPGDAALSARPDNRCYFEARCAQRMTRCATCHPITSQHQGHEVLCLIYE